MSERTRPPSPVHSKVLKLLLMFSTNHGASAPLLKTGRGCGGRDQHGPRSVVGASATTGANMPAKFKQTSSAELRPLYTMSATPTAIMLPTKIARTGV